VENMSGLLCLKAELTCTPTGVMSDPVFFQKVKNLRVMNSTEAVSIDRVGNSWLTGTPGDFSGLR